MPHKPTPEFPPFLSVSGTNYEIGHKVGLTFKDRIRTTLDNFAVFQKNKEYTLAHPKHYKEVLASSEKYFPQYVQELHGYADGSGIEFQDIFIHNCMHVHGYEGCSTGIFRFDQSTSIVQNEDWWQILGDNTYFLWEELENGTSFFVYSYPGVLPGMSFGFNSHGMFFCCNGLSDPTPLFGPSRLMFGRNMFEQKTMKDILHAAQRYSPRSGGANYNIVSMKTNDVINFETTRSDGFQTPISDRFFHSNHYVSSKFKGKYPADDSILKTISRYEGGTRLLPQVEKTTEGLRSILWDDSVFLNLEDTGNREHTMATAVVQISQADDIQLRFHPGVRNPEIYHDFSLLDLLSKQ